MELTWNGLAHYEAWTGNDGVLYRRHKRCQWETQSSYSRDIWVALSPAGASMMEEARNGAIGRVVATHKQTLTDVLRRLVDEDVDYDEVADELQTVMMDLTDMHIRYRMAE